MGESFGYASADSLDMSWLPLPRFESRAVRVAVCGLEPLGEGRVSTRGRHTQYPLEVGV
jgi:hypothetical protein